jgi:CHASE2 domain-containing sensor protein
MVDCFTLTIPLSVYLEMFKTVAIVFLLLLLWAAVFIYWNISTTFDHKMIAGMVAMSALLITYLILISAYPWIGDMLTNTYGTMGSYLPCVKINIT